MQEEEIHLKTPKIFLNLLICCKNRPAVTGVAE